MTLDDIARALSAAPLFQGVDAARLKLVALSGEALSFRAGEVVLAEGEEGDAAFVALSGAADVLVAGPQGPARVAGIAAGEVFGEMALLVDGRRTSTVAAAGPLEALRLPRPVFQRLMADMPEFSLALSRLLARRLRDTTRRLAERMERGDPA